MAYRIVGTGDAAFRAVLRNDRSVDTVRDRGIPGIFSTIPSMLVDFAQLPPDARLWIFAAERPLSEPEQQRLLSAVDGFLRGWKAHGEPLAAGRELRYGQFLLVAVDESAAGASGCSIDAMVRTLGQLERELGLELVNHGPVLYRVPGGIARAPRDQFARLAAEGRVAADTIVFNNTLTRLSELRAGRWEVPARDSWHQRAFFPARAAARS